jgi:membrane-bound serine protease (ClpP class)
MRLLRWLVTLLAFVALTWNVGGAISESTAASSTAPTTQLTATSAPAPVSSPVSSPTAVIELRGEIDDFARDMLERRFAEARAAGAKTIIISLDTYGGLVTSGLDISRFLKNQNDLHTIAYVNTKAISAGAMIAMACNEIVMAENAVIGDCAPIAVSDDGHLQPLPDAERAKMESPILADFRDSAERNGHDVMLAEAMVSVARVVYAAQHDVVGGSSTVRIVNEADYKDLIAKGWKPVGNEPLDDSKGLLTLHTPMAVQLGLAKEKASSADVLAMRRGFNIVATLATSMGDRVVDWLSGSMVRALLLTIFLQSLYIALHAPGHGAPEAVAVISLGLLIGIPLLTGYAQWWELLIIFAGLALLAFEIFVFPGHFVSGIIGALMVIGGLILTFVGKEPGGHVWPTLPGTWDSLWTGLRVVTIGLVCSLLLSIWLNRYLPRLPFFNKIILNATTGDLAAATIDRPIESGPAVGDLGIAVTDLRPGGSVKFMTDSYPDGRIAAVVSESGFVREGTSVIVREVAGNRVVVRTQA